MILALISKDFMSINKKKQPNRNLRNYIWLINMWKILKCKFKQRYIFVLDRHLKYLQ